MLNFLVLKFWNAPVSRWRVAMPHPNQFDPPGKVPLLTCPKCLMPMRIRTIDALDGHDRITMACDECQIEAQQDHKRPP
jgi:hypothetical protein